MGKDWDGAKNGVYVAFDENFWKEVLRVLKPGGHLLSFSHSRNYHRMAVAIEDAGFQIRDQIIWMYGTGFPKSQNIGKSIDKKLGKEPIKTGNILKGVGSNNTNSMNSGKGGNQVFNNKYEETKPNSDEAKQYEGWEIALKPAHEPIVMAKKPLSEKNIAENVMKWGTGGINIDECRVKHNEPIKIIKKQDGGNKVYGQAGRYENTTELKSNGRWPANIIHDGSDVVKEQFPIMNKLPSSRYFYSTKASKKEREYGLDNWPETASELNSGGLGRKTSVTKRIEQHGTNVPTRRNIHPTVKPIKLMEYLVKLVTPINGIVLDPFMGSGTTGIAAIQNGYQFIGMEMEEEYFNIAKERIEYVNNKKEK